MPEPVGSDPRPSGTWEVPGRNPALGALILALLLGSLYFLGGNIIQVIVLAVRFLATGNLGYGEGWKPGMDFVDFLSRVYRDNRILILAVTCACQYGILLGLAALMARHWFGRGLGAYAGYSAPPAWAMGMAVLGAIIIMPAVDLASYLSYRLFPAFERLGSAAAALYRWETPAQAALIWLAISVTPAICEEFLFRGILQRGLQRRLAFPWSVLASGVIFALYHQSALALPALALVGAFIGLMYWASGSIWPGMAFHALYNGAVLCMVNYEERLPAWLLRGEYFNPALWAVGVAATGLIAFALVGAGLKRKGRGPEEGAGAAAST